MRGPRRGASRTRSILRARFLLYGRPPGHGVRRGNSDEQLLRTTPSSSGSTVTAADLDGTQFQSTSVEGMTSWRAATSGSTFEDGSFVGERRVQHHELVYASPRAARVDRPSDGHDDGLPRRPDEPGHLAPRTCLPGCGCWLSRVTTYPGRVVTLQPTARVRRAGRRLPRQDLDGHRDHHRFERRPALPPAGPGPRPPGRGRRDRSSSTPAATVAAPKVTAEAGTLRSNRRPRPGWLALPPASEIEQAVPQRSKAASYRSPTSTARRPRLTTAATDSCCRPVDLDRACRSTATGAA